MLKWKRKWWKYIAELEAGLMNNISEMKARLMKKYCWSGSGIDEKILLKCKQDWWKQFNNKHPHVLRIQLILQLNIFEMEAGFMKNIAEYERDFLIN